MLAGGLHERTSDAAGQPLGEYRRHAPERTVLHELVAGHAQTLLAELRDADPDGGGLPRYAERELAADRRCGILAHGFTRVRCQTCHDEIVVAFSCKRRGICPSVIALVTESTLARTLLTSLDLPSEPVTVAPARSPPQPRAVGRVELDGAHRWCGRGCDQGEPRR